MLGTLEVVVKRLIVAMNPSERELCEKLESLCKSTKSEHIQPTSLRECELILTTSNRSFDNRGRHMGHHKYECFRLSSEFLSHLFKTLISAVCNLQRSALVVSFIAI